MVCDKNNAEIFFNGLLKLEFKKNVEQFIIPGVMDTATKMIPYAKITDPDVKNHEKIISKSFNLKIINGLQVSELHYLP